MLTHAITKLSPKADTKTTQLFGIQGDAEAAAAEGALSSLGGIVNFVKLKVIKSYSYPSSHIHPPVPIHPFLNQPHCTTPMVSTSFSLIQLYPS